MGTLLTIKQNHEVTTAEKTEIDAAIERTITLHKQNSAAINKLTFDAVTALAASESRSNELAEQGTLTRIWNGLTGKNQKIRARIDSDMTRVQYASQQMIQKLAEQNLLTFDLVTAVNNKLNRLVLELDDEMNRIYKMLGAFFKQTRADIIQMETRMDKVERNVELLHWNATIEYQMYDGVEYASLPDIEKMICLVNDFFHLSKGTWSTTDLMLLKSTLDEIGLSVKNVISTESFYARLIEEPGLIDRLFDGISLDGLVGLETYQASIVKGVEKIHKLNHEEKYVYETIASQLEKTNTPFEKRELQLSMIHQYLVHSANMDTYKEINQFDFTVELLVDLQMMNTAVPVETTVEEPVEEPNQVLQLEEDTKFDVFLISIGQPKKKFMKLVSVFAMKNEEEVSERLNQAPITIISGVSRERAAEIESVLSTMDGNVVLKETSETYHTIRATGDGTVKCMVKAPAKVIEGLKVAEVGSVYHVLYRNQDAKDILSESNGEVITVLVDNEIVKEGDPIMVVKVER